MHWLYLILNGQKTWEIRRGTFHYRGRLYLAASGTSKIYGHVTMTGCIGPLTVEQWESARHMHKVMQTGRPYGDDTCAWVVSNPVQFHTPMPFSRKRGAVITQKL